MARPKGTPEQDPRISRSEGSTVRGTAHASEDRARSADDGLASAEDRRIRIRNEWLHEALPQPPTLDGFHMCWLSTTNSYDPIYKRARMGYVPVKVEEIPEFRHLKVHSGEWAGCVSVNEMLLFKIPTDRYQELMLEFHHYMPLEEEGRLRSNIDEMVDRTKDSTGRRLGRLEEGFSNLGESQVKKPIFQP